VEVRHKFALKAASSLADSTFEAGAESLVVHSIDEGRREKVLEVHVSGSGEQRGVHLETLRDVGSWQYQALIGSRELLHDEALNFAWVNPAESMISALRPMPLLRTLEIALSRLKVFRINAHACRQPGLLSPTAVLGPDGGNLPGVIAKMRRYRTRARQGVWSALLEAMTEVYPDLSDITTAVNSAGQLEILFHEEGVGRPWRSFEISDGTVQYLALLTLIFDQQNPALVVEEPENGLHSWMLRSFLDRARADARRQVLMTTHSPTVLRACRPEEVLIAWRGDKVTSVAPLLNLDPQAANLYDEQGVDVYEQFDSGFLLQSRPAGL
jgi:hypothetical protein